PNTLTASPSLRSDPPPPTPPPKPAPSPPHPPQRRNAERGTRNRARDRRDARPALARELAPAVPRSAFRVPRFDHRCKTAASALTFSTILGSAPTTASTSSAVFCLPNENRRAATPSSRGTPMAVSTCDGSTAPVEHAEPEEQAIPARSRCISSASLSVPGIDTLVTWGARRP